VIAFDARGNVSPRSDPGSVTTLATTPLPSCTVQLTSFTGGFSVYVTILNTTSSALNGWTVGFTLPASVGVTSVFGGSVNRTATGGTITPATWDTTIGPGGGAFAGFSGYANPITPPSGFTLNGSPCTGA
jgi:Cellulose binding domain